MRISDWSSDVCSSDLLIGKPVTGFAQVPGQGLCGGQEGRAAGRQQIPFAEGCRLRCLAALQRRQGREQSLLGGADAVVLQHGEGLRQARGAGEAVGKRSEEHTSELQSLMRISYAVFCLKKKRIATRVQST